MPQWSVQRAVDRVIESSNTGDVLILSPPTSPPGEAAEGELRGGFFLALSHLVSLPGEAAEGGLREGDTADGSTMTQAVVHLHDVSFCSRCGEDCSALYPEGGSVGPLFHAVPCMQCGWDTGLEYSDAEAYSYGYGGICVACGATQSPHIACLSCGGPVWPDHTDWDYVCGDFPPHGFAYTYIHFWHADKTRFLDRHKAFIACQPVYYTSRAQPRPKTSNPLPLAVLRGC